MSTLLDTELEKFDDQLSNAIDGRHGGTYAPDSALIIGGAGLEAAAFTVTGDAFFDHINVNDNFIVSAAGNIDVDGTANFDGTAAFNALATFNNGIHCVTGNVDFDHDLNVDGNTTFVGTLGVTGAASFGDINVAGTATLAQMESTIAIFGGDTTVNGKLVYGTNGRAQYRYVNATNSDATYNVNDYDVVRMPASVTLSANRTWTLGTTGATAGMRMLLTRMSSSDAGAHTVAVVDGASSVTLVNLRPAAGFYGFAEVIFDGTNWSVISGGLFG